MHVAVGVLGSMKTTSRTYAVSGSWKSWRVSCRLLCDGSDQHAHGAHHVLRRAPVKGGKSRTVRPMGCDFAPASIHFPCPW
jgi:hypothetical protein